MALFVVFEGGEGSGKTTQAGVLFNRLCREKKSVILVHEPGGTEVGDFVRNLFAPPRELPYGRLVYRLMAARKEHQAFSRELVSWMTPEAELFLFSAARAELVAKVIKPSLKKGISVLCDRYVYSTIAYQGFGRQMDISLVRRVSEVATQDLLPDIVFFLDIEPSVGLARKRASSEASTFEVEELAFHQRVKEGYLQQAKEDPGRWVVLDASKPKKQIAEAVLSRFSQIDEERALPSTSQRKKIPEGKSAGWEARPML